MCSFIFVNIRLAYFVFFGFLECQNVRKHKISKKMKVPKIWDLKRFSDFLETRFFDVRQLYLYRGFLSIDTTCWEYCDLYISPKIWNFDKLKFYGTSNFQNLKIQKFWKGQDGLVDSRPRSKYHHVRRKPISGNSKDTLSHWKILRNFEIFTKIK